MFEIEYKGANSVVISTKKSTLVVDPKLSLVGLKDISTKDAVELATEARFALNGENARLNIEGPGEYGVCKGKDHTAVGDFKAVEHFLTYLHLAFGVSRRVFGDCHA